MLETFSAALKASLDNTKGLSTWPWGNSRCLGMVSVYAIACMGTLLVYCGAKFGEFPEV
jgi:hypothetical protein